MNSNVNLTYRTFRNKKISLFLRHVNLSQPHKTATIHHLTTLYDPSTT